MKVLADCHHGDLFNSLQILFEDRLGFELYRPIGLDWFTGGYWRIAEPYGNNIDTVKQFLDINNLPWSPYGNLNGGNYKDGNVYKVFDPRYGKYQKAITLETFSQMDFDLVISSIPDHDESFARLIKDRMPKAKHISQMGNAYQTTEVANVMCSTKPYPVPEGKNVVFYHQEFPLHYFRFEAPRPSNKIVSFVNVLPKPDQFALFETNLPEMEFKSYGIGNRDGTITGLDEIAQIMKTSLFGYHVKPGGDGFGHVIHNWFACGRPVLVGGNDYTDKLAGDLLIDNVTCIDLDKNSFQSSLDKIKYWSDPENHAEMCVQVIKRFREVVDFNKEEQLVRKFLEKII